MQECRTCLGIGVGLQGVAPFTVYGVVVMICKNGFWGEKGAGGRGIRTSRTVTMRETLKAVWQPGEKMRECCKIGREKRTSETKKRREPVEYDDEVFRASVS